LSAIVLKLIPKNDSKYTGWRKKNVPNFA